jgi:hypothetical protein
MQIHLPLVLAHFSFSMLPAAPRSPACAGRRPLAGHRMSEGSPSDAGLHVPQRMPGHRSMDAK